MAETSTHAAPEAPGHAAHGANGADRAAAAAGSANGAAGTSLPPGRAPGDTAPAPSLMQSIKALWQDLPGLVSDRVELLSLELRRAGVALAQIVALGVVAAILGFTAWVLLWGAIVSGLVALGLHLAVAMLVALLLNVVAAAVVLSRVQKQLGLLRLPATRRHLTVRAAVEPLKPSGPPPASTGPAPPSARDHLPEGAA